jgi:hypothetical protein
MICRSPTRFALLTAAVGDLLGPNRQKRIVGLLSLFEHPQAGRLDPRSQLGEQVRRGTVWLSR